MLNVERGEAAGFEVMKTVNKLLFKPSSREIESFMHNDLKMVRSQETKGRRLRALSGNMSKTSIPQQNTCRSGQIRITTSMD